MKREVRLFDELDRFAAGGEITHALAFSFGYDGDTAAERIFTPLIEKYGVRHPVVITSGKVDEGTALGVHVLRAGQMGRVFHPKLFLAIRDEAVFAAIGSANLTRGGLGANLELLTALVFGEGSERPPPRAVLSDLLAFADQVVAKVPAAAHSREKAQEVLRTAELMLPDLPESRRGTNLRFVHSLERPIWEQMVEAHGDDPVTQLVVVSPFFEADDPSPGESDSLVRHALGQGLPWAPRARPPRCLLHTGALGNGMFLPRAALEEAGSALELRPQALSVEPRRLHAKVCAILGKKRTTLLWGSPNFTPAALLRSAGTGGGNVECALVMSVPAAALDTATLTQELDLEQVFHTHRGQLPEPPVMPPPEVMLLEIGEVLYDPARHGLSIHGESYDARIRSVHTRLAGVPDSPLLLETAVNGTGPFSGETITLLVEEDDPDTHLRRLRSPTVLVEALGADGSVMASRTMRLNVRFDDALEVHGNVFHGADALGCDALLVPSSAPPEQRIARIEKRLAWLRALHRGDGNTPSRHQASLDTFFRNVRHGLDARFRGLVERRGSRFALLRWSTDLSRALAAAQGESLDTVRRVYFVNRVAAHIEQVASAIPGWHQDLSAVRPLLSATKLFAALEAVPLTGDGVRPDIVAGAASCRERALKALRRFGHEEGT